MASDRERTLWTLLGMATGVAAGVWLWQRGTERLYESLEWTGPEDAASEIAASYAADPELAGGTLEVAPVSHGVVEVTGVVATREQRERAVAMAHNATEVHTVVNRIVLASEEGRLEANRARVQDAEPPLQHDGMGVGMGRRRQSPETDPDRPSDRQKLLDRELDVGTVPDALEDADRPVSEEPEAPAPEEDARPPEP